MMSQAGNGNLKRALYVLYEELYKASEQVSLGCVEFGCGELCEDGEFLEGLIPDPVYQPKGFRGANGEATPVMNGSYYWLPFEHEFIAEKTGVQLNWPVETLAGLPVAHVDEFNASGRCDDRCSLYEPFSRLCPIWMHRPVLCRSYPLIPEFNPKTRQIDIYVEMMCPFSQLLPQRSQYYNTWVRGYAELAKLLPDAFWEQLNPRMHSSIRVLGASYNLPLSPHIEPPKIDFPLVWANWREVIQKHRAAKKDQASNTVINTVEAG